MKKILDWFTCLSWKEWLTGILAMAVELSILIGLLLIFLKLFDMLFAFNKTLAVGALIGFTVATLLIEIRKNLLELKKRSEDDQHD